VQVHRWQWQCRRGGVRTSANAGRTRTTWEASPACRSHRVYRNHRAASAEQSADRRRARRQRSTPRERCSRWTVRSSHNWRDWRSRLRRPRDDGGGEKDRPTTPAQPPVRQRVEDEVPVTREDQAAASTLPRARRTFSGEAHRMDGRGQRHRTPSAARGRCAQRAGRPRRQKNPNARRTTTMTPKMSIGLLRFRQRCGSRAGSDDLTAGPTLCLFSNTSNLFL
jgi:hypothetical protein